MSKTAPATLICEICKKPKSPHDGMLAELIRPSLLEFIIHCHFIAIFVALLAKIQRRPANKGQPSDLLALAVSLSHVSP